MTAEPRVGPSSIITVFAKRMASALFEDCLPTKCMTICQWVTRIASGLLRLITKKKDRQPSLDHASTNNDSLTMTDKSPNTNEPLRCLLIGHSKAIREATSALKSLIAIEVHMEDCNLRILDTEEIDGAGSVPSLVVGDRTYYERALIGAVSGHGRLRDACWRVAQEDGPAESARIKADFNKSTKDGEETETWLKDGMAAFKTKLDEREKTIEIIEEEKRKLRQTVKDLTDANQDLRRQHSTRTYNSTSNDTDEDQPSSEITPRGSHGTESRDLGLLCDENEASDEGNVPSCSYTPPDLYSGSQEDGIPQHQPHLAISMEAKVDGGARSVGGRRPLGNCIQRLSLWLRYLCALPFGKLVDVEKGQRTEMELWNCESPGKETKKHR